MKYILFSFLFFACCFFESNAQIKVVTFNIRYDNKDDGINQWSNRKEHVAELVKFHGADFIVCKKHSSTK